MCCFNKINLSAILLVHKRIINKDCTVKNNNENSGYYQQNVNVSRNADQSLVDNSAVCSCCYMTNVQSCCCAPLRSTATWSS